MTARTLPSLAALFLVVFDQKVGYVIAWSKTCPDVQIAGVEYKSLPSGLHDKAEDVVYFMHDQLAGVSAFAQTASDTEHRNARFAAIGALTLVRDSHLALAWQFAQPLKQLAKTVIKDLDNHEPLETYWSQAERATNIDTSQSSLKLLPKPDVALTKEDKIHALNHPARSLTRTLDLFGPLLFPLQRQGMLAKRILVVGHPPVQDNCEIVHNISLLSQLASNSSTVPLYSVGIADMASLLTTPSWTACTTDAILRDKAKAFDILVDLPDESTARLRIRETNGNELQATQRDVQRFHALHHHLWLISKAKTTQDDPSSANDETSLINKQPLDLKEYVKPVVPLDSIESYTWSRLAQRSVLWWSSPGEQNALEQEDADLDQTMLRGFSDLESSSELDTFDNAATFATIITSYFRASSTLILDSAAQIIAGHNADDDTLGIPATTLRQAGLDVWSQSDHTFFEAMVEKHSGKKAKVFEEPITLCGLRVC